MASQKITAGDIFPRFNLAQVGGGVLAVGQPGGDNDWQLVVVYRGKHCPICTQYLVTLAALKERFAEIGVDVVAISGDPQDKAAAHAGVFGATYPVGYDLSTDRMKTLGLYISHPRSARETDRPFAEPGLFVINGDGKVQVTDISNAPFARPDLESLVGGLKFIRDPANQYPIRGTYS